jgi:hypothetical protein
MAGFYSRIVHTCFTMLKMRLKFSEKGAVSREQPLFPVFLREFSIHHP